MVEQLPEGRPAHLRMLDRVSRPGSDASRGIHRTATTFFTAAFFILLVVLLPIWMLAGGHPYPGSFDLILILWVIVAYAGWRLTTFLFVSEIRLATSVFWLFVYVAFGLAPLAEISRQTWPVTPADTSAHTLELAAVLVLVGCASFDLVPRLTRSWRRPAPVNPARESAVPVSPSRPERHTLNERRLWLLSVISLVATPLAIVKLGGISVLFSNRAAVESALINNGLYGSVSSDQLVGGSKVGASLITTGITTPVYLCFLVWTVIFLRRREARDRRTSTREIVLWVLLLAANVILNNPISNPRYWFVTIAISFLAARPKFLLENFRRLLVAAVLFAIVVFPYSDYFRQSTPGEKIGAQSPQETLATKDYDVFPMLASTTSFVRDNGLQAGRQALGVVLFALPRSVWPNKPVDTGTVLAGYLHNDQNYNLSSSLWSEGYIDFGPIGVLAYLALLGIAALLLDRRYSALRHQRAGPLSIFAVAAPIFAGYELIILRGPLLQATGRAVVLLVALLFVFSGGRGRSISPSPANELGRVNPGPTDDRPRELQHSAR